MKDVASNWKCANCGLVNWPVTMECRRCHLARAHPELNEGANGFPADKPAKPTPLSDSEVRVCAAMAVVLGGLVSGGPWIMVSVLGMYGAKLTAVMFVFGSPMIVFGLANIVFPLDLTTKAGEWVAGVLALVAFGFAGVLTFYFGQYVGLW